LTQHRLASSTNVELEEFLIQNFTKGVSKITIFVSVSQAIDEKGSKNEGRLIVVSLTYNQSNESI
jgi:hypothetical protein